MKKIFYISTRYPFPVKSGREKMIEQTLKFLSDEFEIYFAFFSKKDIEVKKEILQKYNIKRTYALKFPNIAELTTNFIFKQNKSIQERLFFSKKNLLFLKKTIKDVNPDIVITDMIRTAQYIENLNIKKILDMDDLLSVRYERYTKQNYSENKLLGTFSSILPNFVSDIADKYMRNLILNHESKKIKKREIELSNKFDAILLVSPKEAEQLKKITGKGNIYNFPPAVKLNENIYNPNIQENNFLFIGNMRTSQNLSSIKFITEKIFPTLSKKISFKLKIVGIYDDRLEKIVAPYQNYIDLLGFVEDIESVVKKSKLLLSPIAFGTGIKTKILDAMSYGLPVITNSVGAEGLYVKKDFHCIIEDEPIRLANRIVDSINNKYKLNQLSKNGYSYVQEIHNPVIIQRNLLQILKEIIDNK